MKNKRIIRTILALVPFLAIGSVFAIKNTKSNEVNAAVDINDYSACQTAYNNNSASSMITALRNITAPGKAGSYNDLWTTYNTAYVRADGKIFDYYSSKTNYVPGGSAQGASYKKEGDAYNREHSIPQSWWGTGTSNQGADPFIVVPTDGYVNNGRGNYPFGEVGSATHTYSNSKKGSAKSGSGYSGTVFEPDDSVKGDFARIYFYAIAKYSASYGWTQGEGDSCFSGSASTNYGLTNYAIKLFSKWSNLDPVSDWERSLNDKLAPIQGNRNPFIDHPEYANTLWGSHSDYTTYNPGSVAVGVSISSSSASLEVDETFNISATSTNSSTITWSTADTTVISLSSNTSSSGNSITVTALSEGTATLTASATINNENYSNSCSITVTSSGGSGGGGSGGESYSISYADLPTSYETDRTIHTASSGIKFISYNCAHYNNAGKMQFKGSSGYIESTDALALQTLTINDRESNDLTVYGSNVAGDFSSTITGTNDVYNLAGYSYFRIARISSGAAYCASITIELAGDLTVSSIDISGNYKTDFYVGDEFSFGGTVTATYSDGSTANVTSQCHFDGYDMSVADEYSVEVSYTYGEDTVYVYYDIDVDIVEISSISASVDKTFTVGETISKNDITVKDNFNNTITDFEFESYQYKYSDAASGGALTNKNFAITYGDFSTTLATQVKRVAYANSVTDTLTRETTGVSEGSTSYTSWSGKSLTSSAVYAGQSAGGNNSIQIRTDNNNSGIITTASGGSLSKVVVNWYSGTSNGRTLNVYGKNSPYTSPTELFNTNTQGTLLGTIVKGTSTELNVSGSYAYVGVRSSASPMYLTSISFSYGPGDNVKNVANYIMYEDTNNQCTTKFSVAKGYFEGLTTSEHNTFMSSNDYVIKTARERFEAWARNLGKSINHVNGDYVVSGLNNSVLFATENNSNVIVIAAIMSLTSTALLGFVIYKKRRMI